MTPKFQPALTDDAVVSSPLSPFRGRKSLALHFLWTPTPIHLTHPKSTHLPLSHLPLHSHFHLLPTHLKHKCQMPRAGNEDQASNREAVVFAACIRIDVEIQSSCQHENAMLSHGFYSHREIQSSKRSGRKEEPTSKDPEATSL